MNHIMKTALTLAALGVSLAAPLAQTKKGANPFQGFTSDSSAPVNINSEQLEYQQEENKAIFSGNVVAVQGESTLRSAHLIAYFLDKESGTKNADPTLIQTNQLRRLEATGGVVVTSQDQKATGASGVFDITTNTATLSGNVVLTQGENVIRGKQLVINMKTGVARVIGGTNALFVPGSANPKPQ